MSNMDKFDNLKDQVLIENEEKYGNEIRSKYGEEEVNSSYKKVRGMTEAKWNETELLGEEILEKLKQSFDSKDPSSDEAQELCDMHRRWLCMFWGDSMYSKEAHKSLAEGYVQDERFTAYYDKVGEGCTIFLRDAINIYCK